MSNVQRIIAVAALAAFSLQSLAVAGDNVNLSPANNQYFAQTNANEIKAEFPSISFSRENQTDANKQRTVNIIILPVVGALLVGMGVAFAVNQR
jgi:hypothetical protein